MIEPIIVERPEDIGLDRHAVIEASAGTGKTYTIENIVLRLILAKVKLEKILVVTFTEKATGELKKRIRDKIAGLLSDKGISREEKLVLKDSLETFDSAHIFTIHGFCYRILQQYAFENSEPFSWTIQDDMPIYEKMLKDQMRRDWKVWFGADLPSILRLSAFAGKEDAWMGETIRLARAYHPGSADRIIPEPPKDPAKESSMPHLLRASAVVKLKKDVAGYKREHNLASFDDMLNFVGRSLDASGTLVEELRRRYSYCLVDEFQDTDKVQWNIFRRIFLEGRDSRLFVIGDPKQAIYSFRNADVYAYIDAKREMIEEHNAAFYALHKNWRSVPALINGFNRLFGEGVWFPDPDIEYRKVRAPSAAERKTRLYADRTGRAAITAVDLSGAANGAVAHRCMAKFIADEIARLLAGRGNALIIGDRKESAPLSASDICVLVKAREKARLVEKFLKERNIPYSFYKKRGLYQSEEAAHIRYLLGAIVDPSDGRAFKKALLTPFFGIAPQEVEAHAVLPPSAPLKELFQKWFGWAIARKWPELFRSIMEDTGVYYREHAEERRLANYRHILENLETEAISGNLDIVDLVATLDRYLKAEDFDDETFDMHRLETEKPKVRIMTIHAAKGLEYPVVFIADGFGELPAKRRAFWKYHDAGHRIVYDLVRSDANEAAFKEEIVRENRELYYVALTRAKYKLYVPYFPGTSRSKGPLFYIVHGSLDKARKSHQDADGALGFVDPDGRSKESSSPKIEVDSGMSAAAGTDKGKPRSYKIPDGLFPDASFSFEDRKIEITSYSGLRERIESPHTRKRSPGTSWITYYGDEDVRAKEDDDEKEKAHPLDIEKGRPALPSSNLTGSMLHEILEEIDFTQVGNAPTPAALLKDAAVASLIERKLAFYGLVKAPGGAAPDNKRLLEEETASIVWNTINTAMKPGPYRLARLGKGEKLHELEFYYPLPGDDFLMGYIDLLFRFKDKYFILDWKSNYLENGYSAQSIQESMDSSGYDLQYKVYTIAVHRRLKACVKDYDYRKNFGGIYYIYLRGMDVSNPDEGYFFRCPKDEREIRAYEDEIFKLVNR